MSKISDKTQKFLLNYSYLFWGSTFSGNSVRQLCRAKQVLFSFCSCVCLSVCPHRHWKTTHFGDIVLTLTLDLETACRVCAPVGRQGVIYVYRDDRKSDW